MPLLIQKYALTVVLVFLPVFHPAEASEILRFERISDRDGLSQNTVRCILQDSRGFIWMGTVNGLNRYSGKEFLVMSAEKGNTASLPDNRIRSMKEDRDGYIWIRTTADIMCCYDTRMERFIDYDPGNPMKDFSRLGVFSGGDVWLWGKSGGCCRVRHLSGGELQSRHFVGAEPGGKEVSFVYEDTSNRIWIGSRTGLFRPEGEHPVRISPEHFLSMQESDNRLYFINDRYILPFDPVTQTFGDPVRFPGNRQLSPNMTTASPDGQVIFIASKGNMLVFDMRKMQFIPSAPFFGSETIPNATFYTDNKGALWIYNHSGNIWGQLSGKQFEKISLIPESILSLIDAERYEVYHDSHDIIRISTYGNGLFACDRKTGKRYHYTTGNSDLPTNYLLCVTEDRSGEIWVGTEFMGACKISPGDYPFRIFYPSPSNTDNRSNAVRLIYQDSQGRFWTGTRNSYLHICDSAFHKIRSHRIEGGLPFCMMEDLSGNIWLGTRGGGLVVFPPSGKAPVRRFHLHDINRQTVSSDNIYDILLDTKNRIWIASFGGGLHYADLNEKEISFRHINTRTVNQDIIRAIMQDRTGLIWAGTNEGVIVFDPDELLRDPDRYINFHFDTNNPKSIGNNQVKAIFEDSRGRLWFGTTGGGLNLLIREEPLDRSWFKHYTVADGLSNDVIQTILEDNDGHIWVSTEGGSGISRFNPETGHFENFNFSNDREAGMFNEASSWKTEKGELMFGSYSGIYIFDPSHIKYNPSTQPVVITELKINGANMRPGQKDSPLNESITRTRSIRLKHSQNSFDIEFAVFNFRSPNFNQYTYYLDGYEGGWGPAHRHNIASYRNVPPGAYTFKVKGSNSLGVWTDSDTELKITITPPFLKSSPAYVIYCVLFIAAALLAFKIILKINRLNTDVKVERQLMEYKLRFFTNISHEFRTPLTIIRGLIENLESINDIPPAVAEKIRRIDKTSSRLLRLIEQLLEFRRLQNKGLELRVERTEAVAFFYDIYQTFKEMADRKKIEFLFKSGLSEKEMLMDRSKFDKIACNLLSNALKHTPENGIILMRLTFSETDDRMTLSVSDSGAGIPKEKREALFVRFAQLDRTSGGTGIGLHLTSELATLHKGKVEYSDSELGGACFCVSVPLSDANYSGREIVETDSSPKFTAGDIADRDIPPESTPPDDKPPLHDYRILVIEDDGEIRDFIVEQLKDSFVLSVAANGTEGLEKAMKEQPTLIVCDVMMPGMNGFDVTRRLKNNFLTSHIPVILLTAHSSEAHRLEGIQAGADSYVTKPFSVVYLKACIVKLVEQREKLRWKFEREPGNGKYLLHCTEKDKAFIDKITGLIEQNIENSDFSVDDLARSMGTGRTNFYKKVKGLTGHSPNEYVRIIRMKKAAELLTTTSLNVSEVSYKVGINAPLYFSKCFKAQFGKSPSQFQKNQ